jgi:phage tail sheath protein FI
MITTQPATSLAGGASGTAPTSDDVVAALEPFASRQQYNVNLIINGGLADPIVQRAMDNLAKYRGDAVALLDIPSGYQEWNKAVDYRNLLLGICSDYSALFAPDLLHTVNGMQVYSPMSGFAAALCARTDRVATPGHSPAGVNRGRLNVLGARYQYTDPQCDALFKAHVNFTKTLSAVGTVLWEQQLLDGNVRWLSVRRVLNVIKTSVHSYLLYALQEMNTETVRRELTNAVNSYLERAVNSQAISAGVMICDGRNNNHSTALAGVLVATVRIIPIIPIHEIVLNIEVSQGGVAFSEQIGYTPTGTSNTTTEFSSRNTSLPGGSSSTTTQFSSGTSLPGGSSSITNEFSSRNSALPSGSSSTTIEYSSGTYLPGGTSNTTNEYSSTRPF